MATLATAQEKYAQKARVMPANYVAAMSQFIGKDISGSLPARAYAAKVNPAAAQKWANNLRNAFGA